MLPPFISQKLTALIKERFLYLFCAILIISLIILLSRSNFIAKAYLDPVIEYGGVRLGSQKRDVIHKIGKPDFVASICINDDSCKSGVFNTDGYIPGTSDHLGGRIILDFRPAYPPLPKGKSYFEFDRWIYKNTTVIFGRRGSVDRIVCSDECSPVHGIKIGASREILIGKLGMPDRSFSDGHKNEEVWFNSFGLLVRLKNGKVIEFAIGDV